MSKDEIFELCSDIFMSTELSQSEEYSSKMDNLDSKYLVQFKVSDDLYMKTYSILWLLQKRTY